MQTVANVFLAAILLACFGGCGRSDPVKMHAYVRATNRLPCAVQLHYAVNDGEKQTVRIEPGDEAIFVTPQTEEPLI